MAKLADPSIGPSVDVVALERERVRELEARWALGDDDARHDVEIARRQLEALERRVAAEAAKAGKTKDEIDATIAARRKTKETP